MNHRVILGKIKAHKGQHPQVAVREAIDKRPPPLCDGVPMKLVSFGYEPRFGGGVHAWADYQIPPPPAEDFFDDGGIPGGRLLTIQDVS